MSPVQHQHTRKNRSEHRCRSEINGPKRKKAYQGWPSVIKDVPQILKPYWSYRDEITIEEGVIMKGSRIIMRKIMQSEIIAKLHEPHQITV